jgi:hypothetical protein
LAETNDGDYCIKVRAVGTGKSCVTVALILVIAKIIMMIIFSLERNESWSFCAISIVY